MKRICSLVLVLCMVLSMVVVPTLATETTTTTIGATKTPLTGPITPIGETDTIVTVGGVDYTVIRTAEDFKTKMTAGGNFILANDIDFGPTVATAEVTEGGEGEPVVDTSHAFTTFVVDATAAFTFDGNGYTLSNMSFNFAARASLFKVAGATATVKNLKITTGNVMNFAALSGILFTNATADIVVDNVDIHVPEFTSAANNSVGLYMGSTAASGTVSFKDCDLTGNINMANQINSGFISQSYSTVTLTNCLADVNWQKNGNRNVPFVGEIIGGSVTMTNCTAKGTFTENGGKWASPFVSGVSAGNITLTKCENAMNLHAKGDRTGGLIGGYLGTDGTSHIIIEDCVVSGVSWNVQSAWMAQAGAGGAKATMEFKGTNKLTGYVMLGGSDAVANIPNAPVSENAVNTGAVNKENGELAFYYAAAQKAEGITDPAEIYGQQIGVDTAPVKGGKTVYRRQNTDGSYDYANKPFREVVSIEIPENATTVTYEGQTLTVVRTLDEFKAMTAGSYVLANDIDFTGFKVVTSVVKANGDFTLYGNGHALKNIEIDFVANANDATLNGDRAGLFTATGKTTVKELTVYATAKIASTVIRAGIMFGEKASGQGEIVAEGVHVYADVDSNCQQFAYFVGNTYVPTTFVDCSVNGDFTANGKIQQGGFIGITQANGTFTDCKANLNIVTTQNRVSPFIGQTNATAEYKFSFCDVTGTLIANFDNNYGAASYIGCYTSDADTNTITFDSCSTSLLIVGMTQAGGFLSGTRNAEARKPVVTFKDCVNNATIISAGTAGAWIGAPSAGTFTVIGCINNAKVTGASIVTVTADENATAKVKDLSALNAADGSLAYALAEAQRGLDLDAKYIFGQTIGTDATPVIGGAKLYKGKDLADKDIYTNTPDFTSAVIPADATTYTVGGVTYNVIRTPDDLRGMRGENTKTLNTQNYILANNIDLGDLALDIDKGIEGTSNVCGFIYYWSGILDGNGYSITGFSLKNDRLGFFDASSTKVDITVKNLTFGSENELIYSMQAGSTGAGIVTAVINNNSNLTLENVDVYAEISSGAGTTTSAQKGGFIGCVASGGTSNDSVIVLRDCTMNGKVHGRNKIAGFFGSNYSLAKVSMYNCVNNAQVTGRTQVAAFMGISQVGAEVLFENCVNNGKIINVDTQDTAAPYFGHETVGAIIGQTPSGQSGGVTTIRNCVNNGEIVGAKSATALVGSHGLIAGTKNVLNIYTNDAALTAETAIASLTDNEEVIVNIVKQVSSDIADEAALKAAIATSGVYTLTADITLSAVLELNIPADVDVTIVLAGKTITGEVKVNGIGNLTIKNGTLKSANDNAALTVVEDSVLKLSNVTVEANKTAAVIEGDLTAEDSTFTSTTANAVEFHKGSQSTLSNCKATGAIVGAADGLADSAADVKDGMTVTIDGGEYTSVVWESETTLTIKGGIFDANTGDAILVKNGTVTVAGGSVKGTNFLKIDPAADATVIVTVTGGEFYGDMVVGGANTIVTLSGGLYEKALDNKYLGAGYEFAKGDGETMYQIKFHTHTFADVWTYNNSGNHKKKCTFPGCEEGETAVHEWSKPVDNGDGKHSKVCSVCGGKSTPQAHKLTCTDNGDGTHSSTCKECNLDSKTAHNYGDATSIAGGKHEKACADCGNVLTEDCTAGADGKCSCGATVGGGSTDNGGKKKGCKSGISSGLFVLLSVLAVPAVTVRKRREDR